MLDIHQQNVRSNLVQDIVSRLGTWDWTMALFTHVHFWYSGLFFGLVKLLGSSLDYFRRPCILHLCFPTGAFYFDNFPGRSPLNHRIAESMLTKRHTGKEEPQNQIIMTTR